MSSEGGENASWMVSPGQIRSDPVTSWLGGGVRGGRGIPLGLCVLPVAADARLADTPAIAQELRQSLIVLEQGLYLLDPLVDFSCPNRVWRRLLEVVLSEAFRHQLEHEAVVVHSLLLGCVQAVVVPLSQQPKCVSQSPSSGSSGSSGSLGSP